MNARLYYRVTDYEMDALHIPALPYFFHFANASANGLLVNSSSCFFIYLLISFLDTRVCCVFFFRFSKASSFSLRSEERRVGKECRFMLFVYLSMKIKK